MPRAWTLITAAHSGSGLFVNVSVHNASNPTRGNRARYMKKENKLNMMLFLASGQEKKNVDMKLL